MDRFSSFGHRISRQISWQVDESQDENMAPFKEEPLGGEVGAWEHTCYDLYEYNYVYIFYILDRKCHPELTLGEHADCCSP